MKFKSLPILLLTFFLMALSFNALGQTNLPRIITSDQTWTKAGSPYIITQNTLIDTGVTITVMPGVVIKGDSLNILDMDVKGDMYAIGTETQPISFENFYMTVTGKSCFEWCVFGEYQPYRYFKLTAGNMCPMKHCRFSRFDAILNGRIDSCSFRFGGLHLNGEVKHSHFKKNEIFIEGGSRFEENVVDSLWVFEGRKLRNAVVTCNKFHMSRKGINLPLSDFVYNDTFSIEFSYNTMDSFSFDHRVGRPAIVTVGHENFDFRGPKAVLDLRIHHNNFLRNVPEVDKVRVFGTNSDVKSSVHIDFKNNYWGSADTNVVEKFIGDDYLDDFNIFATIDYKPILTEYDTTCYLAKSTCKASYYLAQDTTDKFNLFVLNNSTGRTKNTTYRWSFGDGTTSNVRRPKHRYKEFGRYELCLTVENQYEDCYHTFCDSIGVDSLGRLLKAEDGFTINIVGEKDFLHAPTFSVINDFKVYPNPSNGMVNINLDLVGAEMVDLRVLNSTGQLVLSRRELLNAGSQEVTIDLSNEANGLYFIQTQVGRETRTAKVIKKN